MKKKYRFLSACLLSGLWALPAFGQEDFTSRIQNPSFEINGVSGWICSGLWSQTNDSPSGQGWQKDGNVYAEQWVSEENRLADADLYQEIGDLPGGTYRLSARAHANHPSVVAESVEGVELYAGMYAERVSKGGTYEVQCVVANGTLKIGFRSRGSNANWMAVDHFQLFYMGEDLAGYRDYMQKVVDQALADTLAADRPDVYNREQYQAAFRAAEEAGEDQAAVLEAIRLLEAARADYAVFQESYAALKSLIVQARSLYRSSDYPGKDVLAGIIEEVALVCEKVEIDKIPLALQQLEQGMKTYVAGRPSEWVTIKNGALWQDSDGNAVQAHGAGFVQVGDTWYMIGEDRSGWWNPDVNLYSSKNLVDWKFERKIIRNGVTHPSLGKDRFIERPKLMYCKKTGKFVVWCHWEQGNYGASEAAVFYCDSVNGDYKYHWSGRPLGIKSRDCNVFVDDDGTAYFISTTNENQDLGLFRLSDDYLEVVSHTPLFQWQRREAPAIVRVEDTYFMLSSACSGWDPNQCKVSYSNSLTSGWSGLSGLGSGIAFDTQAASILTVKGTEGTTYLYVGDRWQDPGLPESKTIVFPISFEGKRCVFRYRQQFDIDFTTGLWRETPTENTRVPKKDWTIMACSSQEISSEKAAARYAIDDNLDTKWHTRYSGSKASAPHIIAVDMGAEYEIDGFLAMPRMDDSSNGLVREFTFEVSTDGETWVLASGGSWMPYGAEIYFPTMKARYFRFTALSEEYASVSEFYVLRNSAKYTPYEFSAYFSLGESGDRAYRESQWITIQKNKRLEFKPRVLNAGIGSWAFAGPNRHVALSQNYVIPRLAEADAGIYTSVYFNAYGQTSRFEYWLKNKDDATVGIDEVQESEEQPVEVQYYSVGGSRLSGIPVSGETYIERKVFVDGTVQTEKILNCSAD